MDENAPAGAEEPVTSMRQAIRARDVKPASVSHCDRSSAEVIVELLRSFSRGRGVSAAPRDFTQCAGPRREIAPAASLWAVLARGIQPALARCRRLTRL